MGAREEYFTGGGDLSNICLARPDAVSEVSKSATQQLMYWKDRDNELAETAEKECSLIRGAEAGSTN